MRLSDLLALAVNNLRRRRMRTVLTVLGVVIGTASIVVMVSLGLGMSRQQMELIESQGSLTTITIYNYGGGNSSSDQKVELTDESIKSFERIAHVTGTSPELSVYVQARSGIYEGSFSINGVSQAFLQQMELQSGELPKPNQAELTLVYGHMVGMNFYKPKTWESANINLGTDTIFITFPQGSGSSGTETQQKQKKYILKTAGIVAGKENVYNEYAYSAYCDIDTFKNFLRHIYKKNLVPYPQTDKKGKPLRYYVYDTAYVYVDDMANVSEVQQKLTDMGYQATSNMEWLEQSQKTMATTQAVLGGIGAVSLFVAAIGIMNTMMMSIYERTKEIGVMKVLGCDMRDIRNMFLIESGIIGFLGGIVGLLLSWGVSALINFISSGGGDMSVGMMYMGDTSGGISYIPIWLAAFAIVFAIGIGMLAGYFPAVRAMKLSPLAAIRNS